MGRSATNAVGNSVAASVVAKWEGGLLTEQEAEANAARLDAEVARSLHPDVVPAAA
jgi:Na+/H+-dicarboxylate symporter